jgi:alpha-L-fucosidase
VRWIGNERGVAGDTNWSPVDPAVVPYPGADGPAVIKMLQQGDPNGSVWRPGETDVSIRPGWFHHPAEDARVRTPANLVGLYFTSVGRNSKLLLNVPPTRNGILSDADVTALTGMRRSLDAMFARDLSRMSQPASISIADLSEDITRGQFVSRYVVEGLTDAGWTQLSTGTTIGYRKLDRFAPVTVRDVRVRLIDALEPSPGVRLRVY